MKTQAQQDQYVIEVMYLGESADVLGEIRQVFRDKKGKLYHYSGIKHVWFGETYKITKDHKIATRPERVEKPSMQPTEDETLKYEANKEICKYLRARKAKSIELKKPHRDITRALELLHPFARGMDNIMLKRFMGYIENQLSKKKKRK